MNYFFEIMLTIAIFTRWENQKLLNLIKDLENQDFRNFEIKIYSDIFFKYDKQVINTKWKNISKKRNLAISECKTNFLFLLDDDNRIYNKKFLSNLIKTYKNINYEKKIISPTIYWRNTKTIQSAGIKFCYLFGKVIVNKKIKWEYWETKWMWWNSLFWETKIFKISQFDENIWFIREDIDYCYSLWEKWVKIFVSKIWINHIEKDKNIAEKSFVYGNIFKRKIRNRNIFVKKHWNIFEKIMYWTIWYSLWIIYWKIIRKIVEK